MSEYEIDIDGFSKWLKTNKGKSDRTIKSYIDRMAFYKKRHGAFTLQNNRELIDTYIEEDKSINTVNNSIASINAYVRYLISKGEPLEDWVMSARSCKRVQFIDDIISMADYEFLLKRALEEENYTVYLYARIAGTTGMRLCEMLKVKREHIESGSFDVYGKGAKRRRIYFPVTMVSDVLQILNTVGLYRGYVFSPKFLGTEPYGGFGRGLQKRLTDFADRCGFDKGLVHAHGFRHFFAKEFVRKTRDISLLADLLGHSNLNITRIYLKMTSREQKDFIDKEVTW